MPAWVILPFIQCHQGCGRAESGGLCKPVSRGSTGAAEALTASKTDAQTGRKT